MSSWLSVLSSLPKRVLQYLFDRKVAKVRVDRARLLWIAHKRVHFPSIFDVC